MVVNLLSMPYKNQQPVNILVCALLEEIGRPRRVVFFRGIQLSECNISTILGGEGRLHQKQTGGRGRGVFNQSTPTPLTEHSLFI
jgi:hypothetical protein